MTKAETCLEQSRKNENGLSFEKDATNFCNGNDDCKLVHYKEDDGNMFNIDGLINEQVDDELIKLELESDQEENLNFENESI